MSLYNYNSSPFFKSPTRSIQHGREAASFCSVLWMLQWHAPLHWLCSVISLFLEQVCGQCLLHARNFLMWCKNRLIKTNSKDFPGGSVVKNPPANAGDVSSVPDPGRSHGPQASEWLRLCTPKMGPVLQSPGAETREAAPREARIPPGGVSPALHS